MNTAVDIRIRSKIKGRPNDRTWELLVPNNPLTKPLGLGQNVVVWINICDNVIVLSIDKINDNSKPYTTHVESSRWFKIHGPINAQKTLVDREVPRFGLRAEIVSMFGSVGLMVMIPGGPFGLRRKESSCKTISLKSDKVLVPDVEEDVSIGKTASSCKIKD